jgi:hypothetical protein
MNGEFGRDTLIFNFAAIHRTPGHPDYTYFETNILVQKTFVPCSREGH